MRTTPIRSPRWPGPPRPPRWPGRPSSAATWSAARCSTSSSARSWSTSWWWAPRRRHAVPDRGSGAATDEVAAWVSGQLDLAELDASRRRLVEAEVRALRAQISPHFVYNSLATIASFVRTDPERARELLLEFADFTRYSFRRQGEFTTLAEELRSIDRYLLLEKARFGDRLRVVLRIAPEVLPVQIPYLCLQPLVENAVQHGLARREQAARSPSWPATSTASAGSPRGRRGGQRPRAVRRALAGATDSVGLANVDERLRHTFGDEYGLVVETASAPARRSPCACRSSPRGCTHDPARRLRLLAVDDEPPALDELAFLLRATHACGGCTPPTRPPTRCACCRTCPSTPSSSTSRMPGLSGLELARVLGRFDAAAGRLRDGPRRRAVEAFDLRAVDYLLKPVRAERLAEAVGRVVEGARPAPRRPRTTRSPSSSVA